MTERSSRQALCPSAQAIQLLPSRFPDCGLAGCRAAHPREVHFRGCFLFGLTEPQAGTAAVFVNEVHAGPSGPLSTSSSWPFPHQKFLINPPVATLTEHGRPGFAPTQATSNERHPARAR
jgi:hypothetical protein